MQIPPPPSRFRKERASQHEGAAGDGGRASPGDSCVEGGSERLWHPPRMPHSISITSCSIFIMGNNLTNGEFRLITFRLEK